MILTTAGMTAALMCLMLMGLLRLEANVAAAADELGAAHALMTMQNAVVRRHVRERMDDDRNEFVTPALADMRNFAAGYLPAHSVAGMRYDVSVVAQTSSPLNRWLTIIEGFEHPHGDGAGLLWRSTVVEIHLFGTFEENAVPGVAKHVPQVRRKRRGDADWPNGVPARYDESLSITLPHPSIVAGLRYAVALDARPETALFSSPVVFDEPAFASDGDPCGSVNALTTTETGAPVICVDVHGDGNRVWKEVDEPDNAYCVDVRDGPHSTRKAANMEVAFPEAHWGKNVSASRNLSVAGIMVGGTLVCPDGFTANTVTGFCTRATP